MLAPHPLSIFALHAAVIADIAAAVSFRVGIDDLAIKTRLRHAEPIIVTHHRRRVHHEDDRFALARFAQKRDDAVIGVVKIDPLKAFVAVVLLPERRLVLVGVIEMLHQPAQSVVPRNLEQDASRGSCRGSIRATARTRRP